MLVGEEYVGRVWVVGTEEGVQGLAWGTRQDCGRHAGAK